MLNQTPLRNWLEAITVVMVPIYLLLIVLAWIVPNLSTSLEYRVFGTVVLIGMIPGLISLRLRA